MQTNNLFQGNMGSNMNYQMGMDQNTNRNFVPSWNNQGQMPVNSGFMNRPVVSAPVNSTIPGRVVFSPDQISPQEIPTNGAAALFPLSDGSCIIVKALLPNGTFEEHRYNLEQSVELLKNEVSEPTEFDQVMTRLDSLEKSLGKVLDNLPGNALKTTNKKTSTEKAGE